MSVSRQQLIQKVVPAGNLKVLRVFLEEELPCLDPASQETYCMSLRSTCHQLPCSDTLLYLSDSAIEHNQLEVIRYIWDMYLGPRGEKPHWASLRATARHGLIPIAEILRYHDPQCFQIRAPTRQHRLGFDSSQHQTYTQISVALRHANYRYIDYVLSRGYDINFGHPESSPVRLTLQWLGINQGR